MTALLAKLNLAWNLVIYLLKWPFKRGGGYRQFLEQYLPDRLLPLSSSDKTWLIRFSQCLNCGLCDAACPALRTSAREVFPGPSYLLTTFSRSIPDFPAVRLDSHICEGCDACQRICPNHVPVKEALEFIEAKARELRVAGC